MPVVLQITSDDIRYAEHILLPPGKSFDQERIDFIKSLETLDLQAVPGSGKTTALLAKLLIIERHLPLEDGSGVLVISHTNAAVNEIKERLGKYCPQLFTYPNFVGTIQGFVDEFLAVPYYVQCVGNRPVRIDNDTYLSQFFSACPVPTSIALRSRYRDRLEGTLLKISVLEGRDYLFDNLTDAEIPTPGFSKTTPTYQNLMSTKLRLNTEGYLNFNDAYCLARQYICAYPRIKDVLARRFQYIFVDEMQDMDTHQYSLLEDIFMMSEDSVRCFQRIGDKNQAIFNGDAGDRNVWQDRDIVLRLNGSHRLSPATARVVEGFALHPISIQGLMSNSDGPSVDIRPRLIVYDDNTIGQVIAKFASIIKGLMDDGSITETDKPSYAVAWNTVWPDEDSGNRAGNVRLVDYYSSFARRGRSPRRDHEFLDSYLDAHDEQSDLKPIRDSLLRAVLKALTIEGARDASGRVYSKTSLLRYLAEQAEDEYEMLKQKLYSWSIGIVRGQVGNVLVDLRVYIPQICDFFGVSSDKSAAFMTGATQSVSNGTTQSTPNIFTEHGIEIKVGTVHSVKGQTHTATLYVETYLGAGRSRDVYESQRLKGQFNALPFVERPGVRVKQSAKMMYVGLSRPTHLACFAVHKDRYAPEDYSDGWQVVDITD